MKNTALITAIAAGAICAISAKADVLIDTLPQQADEQVASGSGSAADSAQAFLSSGSEDLGVVTLALQGENAPGSLTVGLYADNSGTPGALLDSLGSLDDSTVGGMTLYNFTSSTPFLLAASTQYWIGLTDSSPFNIYWGWTGDTSTIGGLEPYTINGGGPYVSQPWSMEVTGGASAPDAGSVAGLLTVGLAGIAALRRKLS